MDSDATLMCCRYTESLAVLYLNLFFLASPVILKGFMLIADHSKDREKLWWVYRANNVEMNR